MQMNLACPGRLLPNANLLQFHDAGASLRVPLQARRRRERGLKNAAHKVYSAATIFKVERMLPGVAMILPKLVIFRAGQERAMR